MEIQLRQTTKIVFINDVPARIWEGQTSSGIPIHAFITRIAVENSGDHSEFEAELADVSAPSPHIEAIPLRLLI